MIKVAGGIILAIFLLVLVGPAIFTVMAALLAAAVSYGLLIFGLSLAGVVLFVAWLFLQEGWERMNPQRHTTKPEIIKLGSIFLYDSNTIAKMVHDYCQGVSENVLAAETGTPVTQVVEALLAVGVYKVDYGEEVKLTTRSATGDWTVVHLKSSREVVKIYSPQMIGKMILDYTKGASTDELSERTNTSTAEVIDKLKKSGMYKGLNYPQKSPKLLICNNCKFSNEHWEYKCGKCNLALI
jgi:hypothetical protein